MYVRSRVGQHRLSAFAYIQCLTPTLRNSSRIDVDFGPLFRKSAIVLRFNGKLTLTLTYTDPLIDLYL